MNRSEDAIKASDPSDQKVIDLRSERSVSEIAIATSAVKIAETLIPIMISCKAERANQNVNKVAAIAPIAAAITAVNEPSETRFVATPITTHAAAPAVVPRSAGSAKGLFVAACDSEPAIPRIAPINIAAITRGALICQMIWSSSDSELKSKAKIALHT
jgi:hypothetical protein